MREIIQAYGFLISYDKETKSYEISQPEDQLGKYHIFLSAYDIDILEKALCKIIDEERVNG